MNQDLQQFLQMHYRSNQGFFSYVHIAVKDRYLKADKTGRVRSQVTMKPCHNLKITEMGMQPSAFFDTLYPYMEYYITANGFRNSQSRNSTNMFTYYNIVLDLDCHQPLESEKLEHVIHSFLYFLQEICKAPGIPAPNTIVKTGRGIQLWWAITPISFQLKEFYQKMQRYLMEHIQDILNDHESLRLLSLDHAASGRMAGLYRLPTSYNAKTQSYADVEFWHNDLLNPMDYLDCFPREQNPARRMRTRQNFAHKTKEIHGHYNLCRARERMLHQLFSMRTDCVGFRDLACFILANAYLSCNQSVEQTWSAVYRLNDSFSQPLPRHVLKAYLSTSMNKPYLLTNHKIIALLHITKKEQRMLGFYSVEEKKEQKRKRKRSKYLRNIKIAYYYLKGFTQIEIAHKVGCSQATVSRVLKSLSQIKNCVRMSADKFCRCMQLLWHRIHQTAMPAKLQFRELFSLFSHRGIFSLP